MINNLGSHSQLSTLGDASVSAEQSLMDMIGKTSGLDQALNNQDILALLSSDEGSDFSKLLSDENESLEADSSDLILKALTQNLDKSLLSSDEVKNIEILIAKLDTSSNQNDLSQFAKLIEANPDLADKVKNLLKSQSLSEADNKLVKDVSKLVIKDTNTKVTTTNLNEAIANKDKINKLLGLSSEDLVQSKNDQKNTDVSKLNNQLKNKISKNFATNDSNIIKNNQLNIPSKESKVSELDQLLYDNSEASSELSDSVKLDNSTIIKTSKVNQTTKTMDLNQILSKTDNTGDIIAKIQDYVIQSKVSSEPNVNLTFNHSDLGDVHLNVQKLGADNLAVTITSNSSEAVKFFSENKAELLQTLTSSGLNIADMKLESTTTSNKDTNSNNQSFAQTKDDTPNSKQGEQDKESQRREELWELLNKEVA